MPQQLSSAANRTNQEVKVLNGAEHGDASCTGVSGVYGMNIKGLPFLESEHGIEIVPGAMGAMAASTAVVLWMLKRIDWL